ncbi:uncharacterized protein LOC123320576 isoform X2 [Coccinella septempunctata]|nr:uncharacterized protein LOC123320576 isoform X2 [Coccinella septempunctata]
MELKTGNGLKIFNPLRNMGILTNYDETKIQLEQIKTHSIHSNLQEYMEFIHKYFHFNVYNKSAGILYRAVISRYNMNDFKTYIWPFWSESFQKHGDSREFHQSFLKYWIPFSVQEYKADLYLYLRDQNIPQELLVEILFELRRKRHVSIKDLSEGAYYEDFIGFMENYETNDRAFEILCTFPSLNEEVTPQFLDIFKDYILGSKVQNCVVEKNIFQFIAHIFISEHINIQKSSQNMNYNDFIGELRDFIINSFSCREKNLDFSLKLCKIFTCMKLPCQDLKMKYEVPKKYHYGSGENRYLLQLQENGILDLFTEKNRFITDELVKIFNEGATSDETTMWLLKNAFDNFEIVDLNPTMTEQGLDHVSLHNLEKYINCQKLSLHKTAKERDKTQLLLSFNMIEHQIIITLLNVKICNDTTTEIFDILKILSVLIVANQMGITDECQSSTVTSMLDFMVGTVEGNRHEGLTPKTKKVLEHLFCKILDVLHLSPSTLKTHSETILKKLVILIERSNMRKLVTEVLNLVPVISEMMATFNSKSQKALYKFYKELLNAIVSPANLNHLQKSRMRKHPRLRSLLHAVCKGSGAKQREFVVEAVMKMTWKLRQHNLDPTVHTVLLECLEMMMVEPNFHNYTAGYLEEAIKLSLGSFLSDSWCVKNAVIQLTHAVITRIFGVQQTDNIRLRSFQEFCILFPTLSDLFYDVLSSPSLDDRAIIVLQYLSASEVVVYDHSNQEVRKKIDKFLILLEQLLVSKENYIVKFVPLSIVNLCVDTQYPHYMNKVFDFLAANLHEKPSNVIVNHLVLFKEFVRRINDNYFFLKPMKIDADASIVNVVDKMNDLLEHQDLQYLDLQNIRTFVLDQHSTNCRDVVSSDATLKRWKFHNLIRNFPYGLISKNFCKLFDILCENEGLNFLLEFYLDRCVAHAVESRDFDLIQKVSVRVTSEMLSPRIGKDRRLYRVLLESVLRLKEYVDEIKLDVGIPDDMEEMNFYKAAVIQMILSRKNCDNKASLCKKSFVKLTQFGEIDNFELKFLPIISIFVYKNIEFLDKYLFLKFLLYIVLTDCDEPDFYEFLTKLCKKSVNEDNCVYNLLTYQFLFDFFQDNNVVHKFWKDALRLMEKFEAKAKFPTFYTDTYHSLQIHKDVVNKMMSKF